MNEITICDTTLGIKEYNGQRVVTFKDIDTVHQRPDGTSSRNFRKHRDKFIETTDYYILNQPDEIRRFLLKISLYELFSVRKLQFQMGVSLITLCGINSYSQKPECCAERIGDYRHSRLTRGFLIIINPNITTKAALEDFLALLHKKSLLSFPRSD